MKNVVFYGIIAMVIAVISASTMVLTSNVNYDCVSESDVIVEQAIESGDELVDYIQENYGAF